MPRRRVPIFVLSTGFVLLMFVALRPLFAQPPDAPAVPPANDPSQFQEVRLETVVEGNPSEGKLKLATITLKTEIGSTTINLSHVKRITFSGTSEGEDSVQLTDNSIVHGRVVEELFLVEVPGGESRFNKEKVREIRVISKAKTSIVTIALGLLTLIAMEIVLGVDNIIFLAIIAGRLPTDQQPRARGIL